MLLTTLAIGKELTLEQVLGKDGLYTARFIPNRNGDYTVTATGTLAGEDLGKQQALFEVKPSFAEFSDAALNMPLLSNLASMTGGELLSYRRSPSISKSNLSC